MRMNLCQTISPLMTYSQNSSFKQFVLGIMTSSNGCLSADFVSSSDHHLDVSALAFVPYSVRPTCRCHGSYPSRLRTSTCPPSKLRVLVSVSSIVSNVTGETTKMLVGNVSVRSDMSGCWSLARPTSRTTETTFQHHSAHSSAVSSSELHLS